MARSLRIEYPGAFYHVTSRGNEQKDVFKSQRDREKFLEYLASATARYGAVVHAYCLMSNHYHLLLETPEENLSQIMRHINGAYTTYFNVKRKRAGHLFQGRYKAILVEADEYATELSRYIHLNPVRAGMAVKPEEYKWSSYRSYISRDKATEWLKTEFILGYFGGKAPHANSKYRQFVEDLLDSDYDSPLKATVASTILGSEGFVREISERHLGEKKADRSVPAVKGLATRPSMDDIINKINTVLGESDELARNVSLYFCQKHSGAKLKEIGERFGISDGGIAGKPETSIKNRKRSRTEKGDLSGRGSSWCQKLRPDPLSALRSEYFEVRLPEDAKTILADFYTKSAIFHCNLFPVNTHPGVLHG